MFTDTPKVTQLMSAKSRIWTQVAKLSGDSLCAVTTVFCLPGQKTNQRDGLSYPLTSSLSVDSCRIAQICEGAGATSGLPLSPTDFSATKGSTQAESCLGSLHGSSPSVASISLLSCCLVPDERQQPSLDSLLLMHNGSIK